MALQKERRCSSSRCSRGRRRPSKADVMAVMVERPLPRLTRWVGLADHRDPPLLGARRPFHNAFRLDRANFAENVTNKG